MTEEQNTQKLSEYRITLEDEFEELALSHASFRLVLLHLMDAQQAIDSARRKLEKLIGGEE